jgi:hypothetical protein
MTHDETHETLFDNTIRFERVIYMAGALAQGDSLPDDLREFLEEEDDTNILQAFPGFPISLLEDEEPEFVAEWLIDNKRLGFLVQCSSWFFMWPADSPALPQKSHQ